MLRILLVDESSERSPHGTGLRLALEGLGHVIVAQIPGPRTLWDAVKQHDPDALIIDTDATPGNVDPISFGAGITSGAGAKLSSCRLSGGPSRRQTTFFGNGVALPIERPWGGA